MPSERSIEHKVVPSTRVAYELFNGCSRSDIMKSVAKLYEGIPSDMITGDPYCIMQYITSYREGFDLEVGIPVQDSFVQDGLLFKQNSALEVIALVHDGPIGSLRDTKQALNRFAHDHGLISDEFTREVYLDWKNPSDLVECQFVIHNWNQLYVRNLNRVLGDSDLTSNLEIIGTPGLHANVTERFEWAKEAIDALDVSADKDQKFDIVSSCAHVFPTLQLAKLTHVYRSNRLLSDDPLDAIDAVLQFMHSDPGWGENKPVREGNVIFHTKNPSDPEAYSKAQTPEQQRSAYCFCPIIRVNLDKKISDTYCYCGSGWYRQQWEAATGKPVHVEVVKSVVRGDDVCQFAVHLASDI